MRSAEPRKKGRRVSLRLVDTNVMIAASSVRPGSSKLDVASPDSLELRKNVHQWLVDFEFSQDSIVLDEEGLIEAEYAKNLRFSRQLQEQEYGIQLLQTLNDHGRIVRVTIEFVENGDDKIARLDLPYRNLVRDIDDHKWIACAIAVPILEAGEEAPIFYAAESDWWIIRHELNELGIKVVHLLPDSWYTES